MSPLFTLLVTFQPKKAVQAIEGHLLADSHLQASYVHYLAIYRPGEAENVKGLG